MQKLKLYGIKMNETLDIIHQIVCRELSHVEIRYGFIGFDLLSQMGNAIYPHRGEIKLLFMDQEQKIPCVGYLFAEGENHSMDVKNAITQLLLIPDSMELLVESIMEFGGPHEDMSNYTRKTTQMDNLLDNIIHDIRQYDT